MRLGLGRGTESGSIIFNGLRGDGSTINAKGRAEQAQAPQTTKRTVAKHCVIPTMNLVVRTITKVSLVGPCIVLDFGKEHWMTIRFKNDQEDEEDDCVTQAEITGTALRRNEVLERVAESVIWQFVIRPIVAVFQ